MFRARISGCGCARNDCDSGRRRPRGSRVADAHAPERLAAVFADQFCKRCQRFGSGRSNLRLCVNGDAHQSGIQVTLARCDVAGRDDRARHERFFKNVPDVLIRPWDTLAAVDGRMLLWFEYTTRPEAKEGGLGWLLGARFISASGRFLSSVHGELAHTKRRQGVGNCVLKISAGVSVNLLRAIRGDGDRPLPMPRRQGSLGNELCGGESLLACAVKQMRFIRCDFEVHRVIGFN